MAPLDASLTQVAPGSKNTRDCCPGWLFHITSNLVIACELQVCLDLVVRSIELVLLNVFLNCIKHF